MQAPKRAHRERTASMAFELPPLPYAMDALAPAHQRGDAGVPLREAPPDVRRQRSTSWSRAPTTTASRYEELIGSTTGGSSTRPRRSGTTPSTGTRWRPGGGGEPTGAVAEADQAARSAASTTSRAVHRGRGRRPVRLRLGVAGRWRQRVDHHQHRQRRHAPGPRPDSRCSPATCGSTPTTSTTATRGPKLRRRLPRQPGQLGPRRGPDGLTAHHPSRTGPALHERARSHPIRDRPRGTFCR